MPFSSALPTGNGCLPAYGPKADDLSVSPGRMSSVLTGQQAGEAGMRRIRWGMVGGGTGGFIGEIHRRAARLDDRYELIAGALSSDPERARQSAADCGIPEGR